MDPSKDAAYNEKMNSAWPNQIVIDSKGDWEKGWMVKYPDNTSIYSGILCDKFTLEYAQKSITSDLNTIPYSSQFIDTTTSSELKECYSKTHPMTRTESKEFRIDLLKYMFKDKKLITGSEAGQDYAAPYVHYFEGMMSLSPYRLDDAGYNMQKIVDEIPDQVEKYQVGQKYRLPLWELVYHDCTVSYWYWGDYNNKLPKLWDKRDLFNILYGTPPLFMFDAEIWKANKNRFIQSYKNIETVAGNTGYSEMVDFKYLSDNKDIQKTVFANGISVIVNFGDKIYKYNDSTIINPLSYYITGFKQ